jgi:hypothetical protein
VFPHAIYRYIPPTRRAIRASKTCCRCGMKLRRLPPRALDLQLIQKDYVKAKTVDGRLDGEKRAALWQSASSGERQRQNGLAAGAHFSKFTRELPSRDFHLSDSRFFGERTTDQSSNSNPPSEVQTADRHSRLAGTFCWIMQRCNAR